MDDQGRGGVTDAAGPVVAGQDPFPAPAEAGARAATAVVAGLAQPAAVEIGGAAGTAERELLLLMVSGHRASSGFSRAPSGAAPCGATLVRPFCRSTPSSVKNPVIRGIIITNNKAEIKAVCRAFPALIRGPRGTRHRRFRAGGARAILPPAGRYRRARLVRWAGEPDAGAQPLLQRTAPSHDRPTRRSP